MNAENSDSSKRKSTRPKTAASTRRVRFRQPPENLTRPPVTETAEMTGPPSGRAETRPSDLHAKIQERAYLLFESSGYQHGHDLEHWLEAERQVTISPSKHEEGAASTSM